MESIKEKVQKAVSELYETAGKVTPSALIASAKPKSSPIHDAFEWDNRKAGHEYRLMQARTWLRKVEIVVEERTEKMVHVPLMRNDAAESGEGHYKPASVVVRNVDEYQAAMSAVKCRLGSAKEAYDALKRAAKNRPPKRKPDFKQADKGFGMVDNALSV